MTLHGALHENLPSATELYELLGSLNPSDQAEFLAEIRDRSAAITQATQDTELLRATDVLIATMQSWQLTARILGTPGWEASLAQAAEAYRERT